MLAFMGTHLELYNNASSTFLLLPSSSDGLSEHFFHSTFFEIW